MPYDLVIVSKRFYYVSWLLVCDQHLFPSLIISNFDWTEMEQQQIGGLTLGIIISYKM